MEKSVFLDDMDGFPHREALASGDAKVLIPAGSLKQHGPHLPLGTDTILATRFTEGIALRLGPRRPAPWLRIQVPAKVRRRHPPLRHHKPGRCPGDLHGPRLGQVPPQPGRT